MCKMAILIKRFLQPLQMTVVTIPQVINISTRKCSNAASRNHNTITGKLNHHFADASYYEQQILLGKVTKFQTLHPSHVDKLLHSVKKFGFTWQDLLDQPKILLMPSYSFLDKIHLLKEFGFNNPNLHDLLYCKAHMNSEISFLKFYGLISDNTNVLQHLWENIKDLELPQTVLEEAKQRYPEIETTTLGELHIHFLKHYLSQRFNVEVQKMEDFLLNIINKRGPIVGPRTQMRFKALVKYPAICDVLLNDLQYDFTQISVYPSLLNIDPTSVEKLFTEFSTIGGHSLHDTALEFPEILLIPAENIQQWISLLGKYQVLTFKITRSAIYLFLTADYKKVEERLYSLSRHPDWKMICYSDQLFKILRQPQSVKRLVEALCSDQPLKNVNSTVKRGALPRKRQGAIPVELILYIAQELDLEQQEAKKLLESNNHYGLYNTHMVLKLIKNYGFSREQIMNGIEIIHFEYIGVKEVLNGFAKNPEAQPFSEWMKSPNVIHLLMYLIKKTGLYS